MILEFASYPQIAVENFNYTLTKDEFLTNPYLKIIVYVEKDKIIGFLLYSLIYERIEIEQFEVLKNRRNEGIGSKLLNFIINKYQNKNITNITLEVRESNYTACNLYKKYGFNVVTTRKKYYNKENGILMERKLN